MLAEIRKAQIDDIDAMLPLLQELFSIESDFNFNPGNARKALEMMIPNSNIAVFLAQCQGDIAGMCSIQTTVSTAEGQKAGLIEDLVVDRKFRRKGFASSLLDAVEKWAVEKGIRRLQLLADVTNEIANDFYLANHWSKTQLVCLRKNMLD